MGGDVEGGPQFGAYTVGSGGTQPVGDHDTFDALGVDSLALVEYALALEDVFDVEIPEEEVTELATVGALVDALVEKTAVRASAGLDP